MDIFSSSISSKSHGDASSSSYLNPKDDNFIRKLSESTRYLNNPDIVPGSGAVDGEIGVFGAEKYFNGVIDNKGSQKSTNQRKGFIEPSQKLVLAHHDLVDEPFKPKPWLATTPSVRSETSSNNSQKPLLKTVKHTTSTTNNDDNNNDDKYSLAKRNNNNNKSFLSNTLGYCMCYPCKGETAVDVGEISFSNAITAKPIRSNSKIEKETTSFRENIPFSFPSTGSLKLVNFQEEEVERKSLEVFGSSMMGRLRNYKPMSLEKRLAMLSWDHTNNNNNNLGALFCNDDIEVNSDCSSDLFEIESLTKQTNVSFQSPTASCYAPSEASVEWSVVTASALDFDERRPSTTSPVRVVAPSSRPKINVNNKEVVVFQKKRSSSLLGCKNEKTVRVAEDSSIDRKINAKANYSSSFNQMEGRKLELSMSVPPKRFEDEGGIRCLSFRSQAPPLLSLPHRALATRSLPRPYSPRLSNITFNIQGETNL